VYGQESPSTPGDIYFSLVGIPVRIHPMFWVISLMFGIRLKDPAKLILWVIAVFVSILCHEMGHALVIRWFGFRPTITLYGMGGMASYDLFRPRKPSGVSSWEQIAISFAGPGAGFLLVALIIGILYAADLGEHVYFVPPFFLPVVDGLLNLRLQTFLNFLFFVCAFWGLVNLLPVYPLDGGHIAREVFLRINVRDGIRQSLIFSMVVAVLFAFFAAFKWHDLFIPLFFGCFAFANYQNLQGLSGRGRW
jgi:membrane-associated protease RseP (regulator of RpoE activity)